MKLEITNLTPIEGHPTVRALAEARCQGLLLRGLKLEERAGIGFQLIPPGRKIQGNWQTVFQFSDASLESQLRALVLQRYQEIRCQR